MMARKFHNIPAVSTGYIRFAYVSIWAFYQCIPARPNGYIFLVAGPSCDFALVCKKMRTSASYSFSYTWFRN